MKKIKAEFKTGTYEKKCEVFKKIKVGAIHCVGMKVEGMKELKPCKYYVSHTQCINGKFEVTDEVVCSFPPHQLTIFD